MFNEAQVREQCLDSSIERHRFGVDNLEYTRLLHGLSHQVGYWLLVGPSVGQVAARLRSPRSTPLGMARDIP